MKTAIASATLMAALVIAPATFAGPAPGQPGPGERVADLAQRSKSEREGSAYALTGERTHDAVSGDRTENTGRNGAMNAAHRLGKYN
jgi:hypothetical protein